MVTSGKYVGRIVTLIAGAVALCVAVLLPGVYFLQGQRLLHHDLATKAEVKSEIVGQIVSRSPQLWRYQTVRLIEMLTRAPGEIGSDFAQVLDESGKEILSVGTWPGTPVAVASHEVLDSGFVAGEVRVARSMRGLLHGTAAVGALGLALALLVFGVLRVLPIRALNRAMAALATQLRHREKIAGFSRGMLAQQPPSEMIANAVQVVLEGFQADAVAYVERGASEGEVIVHAVEGLARRPASNIGRCAEGSPLAAALASGEDFDGPLSAAAPALPFEWARGMSAMALAVVPGEAGVRGVLCAFSAAPRSFTAEESAFLDAVASVLSGALLRHGKDDRLAYLAQFDPLTGLPNRALLHDRFSQMIELARRRGSCIAALFVDLDEFKQVNDTLGHAAGDDLLKQVAGRLRSAVRAGDTVARISGDEFAVVLPDLARPDEAGLVAQKLVDVMTTPFLIREQEAYVTASVGVATFPNDGAHAEELLAAADAAMYRAKQLGRSNYQFFTAELNEKSRARAQLSAELRRALEQEEFKLAYQPKVKLDSGGLVGAEALLRWQHPARGMVSPAEFIPPLEESGLIVAVGEWVLRRVCADLKAWASAGLEVLPVAVNLSARQFRQLDLDVRIKSLISSAGIDPGLIELEITESQIMHDPDQAIRMMRSLRDAGLRIAIDDFGTGYSSLSYLTQFPVASLKIDRTFVSKVVASTSDQAIVTTIIDMAYTLGFSIVAEGVETADQAALLQRLGCEQAQGYYFARPMPAEEFVRSLARAAVAAN